MVKAGRLANRQIWYGRVHLSPSSIVFEYGTYLQWALQKCLCFWEEYGQMASIIFSRLLLCALALSKTVLFPAVHPAMPTQASVVSRMFQFLLTRIWKSQSSRAAGRYFSLLAVWNVTWMMPLFRIGSLRVLIPMTHTFMQSARYGEEGAGMARGSISLAIRTTGCMGR